MNLPRECEKCGYSLRKQPKIGSCPECGKGFTSVRYLFVGLTAWRANLYLLIGCAITLVGVAFPLYYFTDQFTQQLSTTMAVGMCVFVLMMAISMYAGIRLSRPILVTPELLSLSKISGPKIAWAEVERLENDAQKLQCIVHYKTASRFSIRQLWRLMSDRIQKITGFENADELNEFGRLVNEFVQADQDAKRDSSPRN